MDAVTFLDKAAKLPPEPVTALYGDEDFLRRECRDLLIRKLLDGAPADLAVSTYPGDKLDFSTVRNELDTLPFLGPRRVVVVEQADPFITAHREALERYVKAPSKVGALLLEAKTFPSTTKLAKALPDAAKLECKAPGTAGLVGWCRKRAKAKHAAELDADAAGMLVELVGPQMGQLDQELAKLAVAVGPGKPVTPGDVAKLVGRSRAANVFRVLDAVAEGNPGEALTVLRQLEADGDDPFAILGALTSQLRKLAAVGRLLKQGQPLGPALDAAGVPKWPAMRQGAERQVRHLGPQRLAGLGDRLLALHMGVRGDSRLPARLQVERLVVELSRPAE